MGSMNAELEERIAEREMTIIEIESKPATVSFKNFFT